MDIELAKQKILEASSAFSEHVNHRWTGKFTVESYQKFIARKNALAEICLHTMEAAIIAINELSEADLVALKYQPQVRAAMSCVTGYKKRARISENV